MSIPITKGGYERIIEEARHLKKVERPAIIAKIAEARSHGDLSENAEYHAAREKQSFIEGRIEYLDGVIADAEVIDIIKFKDEKEKVLFGATVKLLDNDTDEEVVYTLVGEVESDPEHGKISIASPKGRALIGKTLGDDVVVQTPAGAREYEILEVKYV
ncbi:transcription elongation factor GreA [bacterium]|nr:transcription elongation factor GreA [bacterium]